uniref:MADF domain-containing protein n=1 Tax=Angiostrongylus cantonensis TaxID=6313 RepID=A0A0K0CYR3_ANGCA
MSFHPAFNARLIAEVKKHPCLYNHSKRGSGDTMERMRIWENIASVVDTNCSGDFAKKRWLQLRDRYRKELKTAIKQNFVTPIRWCYFSHLVLSTCDGYSENGDSFSNCVDALGLSSVKAELEGGTFLSFIYELTLLFERLDDEGDHKHIVALSS